jgi:hypothetical protein
MCERVVKPRGGTQKAPKGFPLQEEKEEEMRTKKIAMLVAMAAAVVLVALVGNGPALAQQIWGVIQCESNPCYATGAHEVVFEQVGDGVADNMYAQGGHDNLRAQNYTNDNDTANGGTGNDVLHVNDGDALDDARGGSGYDTCVVDAAVEATNSCEMVVFR